MNRSVDLREDLVFAPAGLLLDDYLVVDWASTPLGPVSAWPASLRTALTICLTSQFPVALLWGPQLTLLYNQAYLPMVGRKHPGSLGAPCDQAWSEIWPIIGPMLTGVLAGEPAIYSEDQMFLLERQDFAEECYFTFSYSPIPDNSDGIGGVFTALTETTAALFAARRVALVQRLGDEFTAQMTGGITGILQAAISTLGDSPHDLSDTVIYHCDEGGTWTRHGSEQLLGPSLTPPASHRDQRVQIIDTGHGRVALVPMAVGPRGEGLLACQLNPQVPEDSHLVAFFTQIGRLIGAALTGAASWTADNARITAERVHHQQLLHSERGITEVLHRSLLPALPPLTDLTVAARYAPGESDAHIGGDWYDAIDLGAGRTALIIGDVMGHGVIAAGIMGQLRSAVRAYSQLDLTPAEVLTLIDLMVDQMWETSFVTSLYGVYDPADRSLTLANAGHFAPLLVTGSGPTVTTLAVPPDPPLGTGRGLLPQPPEHRATRQRAGLVHRRARRIASLRHRRRPQRAQPPTRQPRR